MPWQITAQSPIQIFIQEQPHLTRGDRVLSCFFQQRDDLCPLHTGKSFEELLDGIARLQMIEQTLYGHARPGKNRFASEDFRILRHDAAHERKYALEAHSIQANITITSSKCRRPIPEPRGKLAYA
jgi:hypothetical protein